MGSTIDAGSVSVWLKEVRFGGNSAAEQLWQRYQAPLQRVALRALGHTDRQVADEEDVVIQSFSAFLRRIADDGYPQLSNRDELWRLLARITRNYAGKQRQKLSCQKRGGHLERRRQARLWLQQLADQSMS
ncbi:MAG: ECF-type sigma factor, partial [Planctomycetota bacterium]